MSYAFGSLAENSSYSLNFQKNGNTEINFIIFDTHKKEDIIRILKEQITDLEENWSQNQS
jgi:hypothetical protein